MSSAKFTLYTAPTPNGHPISIFLEELKAVNPAINYEYDKLSSYE
jgi:glutathione S-transferase